AEGGAVTIASNERKLGTERVYNIEIETEHSYLVGNARILSHNVNPCAEIAKETADGIIYLRHDATGGMKDYVGQAESEARFAERKVEHAEDYPKASFEFHVLDRAAPGKALDVAEESWILAGGGPTNKGNPGGGLSNGRYQMNDAAYREAGGTVPLPNKAD